MEWILDTLRRWRGTLPVSVLGRDEGYTVKNNPLPIILTIIRLILTSLFSLTRDCRDNV